MGIPEREEIAIPEGFGPHRLLYNPPSETVIAELRSIGERFLPNQLYIRKRDSPRYEPIKGFEPMVSAESAVTSLGRPLLFYLSNRLEKVDQLYKGDPQGLYSFDLQNRRHLKLADKDSLRLPAPYVGGWITGLVDASADATELYLTVGMMPPDASAGFRMVSHQLVRMDLTTGDILPLSHLKGTFF
ncbi:MAG: hypothetical protein WBC67_11675 [Candidatus Acidiferrales bacterium]